MRIQIVIKRKQHAIKSLKQDAPHPGSVCLMSFFRYVPKIAPSNKVYCHTVIVIVDLIRAGMRPLLDLRAGMRSLLPAEY